MAEARSRERSGCDRARAPATGAGSFTETRPFAALRLFARDGGGSTAIEYALIGGLIFLVAAGGIRFFVSRTSALYDQIVNAVVHNN